MFFYFSLCVFNINAFFIESCWEGWRSPSRRRRSSPRSAHRVLPALQRLLLPSQKPGGGGALSGETKEPDARINSKALLKTKRSRSTDSCSPRLVPSSRPAEQPWGWYKGLAHLGPPPAGVYKNQAGAPPPHPEGGDPGADTEESSIKSMREVREAQGGVGSALERRQGGTLDHRGGCHRGGKLPQAPG